MDDIDTQMATNGGFDESVEIVTLNVPPAVWPDVQRLFERFVPSLEVVRMPPSAEAANEAAFMLKPKAVF
jgi:hypothetical protein